MNKILNGKLLSEKIFIDLKKRYDIVYNKKQKHFHLTIIQVGNDEVSKIYINNKIKYLQKLGVEYDYIIYPKDITQDKLISEIKELSKQTNAIFIQLPLPTHISKDIINYIPHYLDIDGFTAYNLGNILLNNKGIIPATPKGIIRLLDEYNINVSQKDILIIGRSNIVGKPLLQLLINKDATVTLSHSKTKNIKDKIKNYDIVITATGVKDIIDENTELKKDVILIDVGIIRENNKIRGDINPNVIFRDEVKYMTPTPNGVGPMTVISLIDNLVEMYEKE